MYLFCPSTPRAGFKGLGLLSWLSPTCRDAKIPPDQALYPKLRASAKEEPSKAGGSCGYGVLELENTPKTLKPQNPEALNPKPQKHSTPQSPNPTPSPPPQVAPLPIFPLGNIFLILFI